MTEQLLSTKIENLETQHINRNVAFTEIADDPFGAGIETSGHDDDLMITAFSEMLRNLSRSGRPPLPDTRGYLQCGFLLRHSQKCHGIQIVFIERSPKSRSKVARKVMPWQETAVNPGDVLAL
jgi:hypothetical protein